MVVTAGDLLPWRDPEQLLAALTSIERSQLPELRDEIIRLVDHEDADVREQALRRLFVHLRDQREISLLGGSALRP